MTFCALKQASRSLVQRVSTRGFANAENLVKTACYDLHKELGGDMVPFAGYELPVLYKGENGGVMKEHLWCRADGKAALFDVSHMGQVRRRLGMRVDDPSANANTNTSHPCLSSK